MHSDEASCHYHSTQLTSSIPLAISPRPSQLSWVSIDDVPTRIFRGASCSTKVLLACCLYPENPAPFRSFGFEQVPRHGTNGGDSKQFESLGHVIRRRLLRFHHRSLLHWCLRRLLQSYPVISAVATADITLKAATAAPRMAVVAAIRAAFAEKAAACVWISIALAVACAATASGRTNEDQHTRPTRLGHLQSTSSLSQCSRRPVDTHASRRQISERSSEYTRRMNEEPRVSC